MSLNINTVLDAWSEAIAGKIDKLSNITSDNFIFVNQSSNEIMKKKTCLEWTIKSGEGQKMFDYKSIYENEDCLVGTHIITTIDNVNYKVMFFAKLQNQMMTEYHVLARFEDYE